jgi:hypothetical protein
MRGGGAKPKSKPPSTFDYSPDSRLRVSEDAERLVSKRPEVISLLTEKSTGAWLLRYIHLLPATCCYVELQSRCVAR